MFLCHQLVQKSLEMHFRCNRQQEITTESVLSARSDMPVILFNMVNETAQKKTEEHQYTEDLVLSEEQGSGTQKAWA